MKKNKALKNTIIPIWNEISRKINAVMDMAEDEPEFVSPHPNMIKLQQLTKKLSSLPDLIESKDGDTTKYKVEKGEGLCRGLLKKKDIVAVLDAFMKAGEIYPHHVHKETEWLVVYAGHIIVRYEDHVGIEDHARRGEAIRILAGRDHWCEAIDDSWVIGITIPEGEGYPDVGSKH